MAEWIMKEETDMDGVGCYIRKGELIRCKDCKHASLTYDSRAKYCRYWDERYDDSTKLYLDSDFYCAAAERKEDG